jgi:tRNA modification GTPase
METLVACLTPPGKAAIATIGVRGPSAWAITRQLFMPRKGELPEEPTVGQYWYGRLGGEHADEVILTAKADSVEMHCHGGFEVVRMVQELFVNRGAKLVPWQQWLKDTPGVTERLAHAPTARTAAVLLDQMDGAWKRAVARIERGDQALLQRLHELIPLGQHLVVPWKVVLAGAPNVGKSSLMNALAGFTRSVVAPTPGTTRDVVTVQLAIDGWPIEMTDTAGIRAAAGVLEQQGIKRALQAVRDADLRIWLLDGAAASMLPDNENSWLIVINKTDLAAAWNWDCQASALRVSAQTGVGIAELCEALSRQLVPNPPQPGDAVPVTAAQVEWVRQRFALAGGRH